MKIKFFASILAVTVLFGGIAFSQQRGVGIKIKKANGETEDVQLYGGSYALIIGNSEYANGWERLSGVKSDVVAVRSVLARHGFQVETEENLTSEQFKQRVEKFIGDYGYDRDNRLIIYYAGHGYTLNSAGDKRELGYIIPADTPLPDKDPRGFRQKAVSMYAIQTFAKDIQAKHALFVFDSCFSGKLFVLRDQLKITPFIYDKVDNPVRQFITAGDETQTVPDESIFRKSFVRGLEGEADRNNDNYITGTELADYLKEKVTNYSERRQTPQYGLINDIDLDRGDFVFVVPQILPTTFAKKNPKTGDVIENSLGMEFVYISAGTFSMGLSKEEVFFVKKQTAKINNFELPSTVEYIFESPKRQITLKKGFWLGRFEITGKQWFQVIGEDNTYRFGVNKEYKSSNKPYDPISWNDAKKFIEKLNQVDNEFFYRLPTEAEWEYAARAGEKGIYAKDIDELGWYVKNSGKSLISPNTNPYSELLGKNGNALHPVGQKQPNAFGLYDILGNSMEFVEDVYSDTYEGLSTDGSANLKGDSNKRVLRGCAWFDEFTECRLTKRSPMPVNSFTDSSGLRIVAVPRD